MIQGSYIYWQDGCCRFAILRTTEDGISESWVLSPAAPLNVRSIESGPRPNLDLDVDLCGSISNRGSSIDNLKSCSKCISETDILPHLTRPFLHPRPAPATRPCRGIASPL